MQWVDQLAAIAQVEMFSPADPGVLAEREAPCAAFGRLRSVMKSRDFPGFAALWGSDESGSVAMAYPNTLILMSIPLLSVLAVADQEARTQGIRTLLDEFLSGASVRDARIHNRLWSNDLVYTNSPGARFGKTEIMAGLSDAGTGVDQYLNYGLLQ